MSDETTQWRRRRRHRAVVGIAAFAASWVVSVLLVIGIARVLGL